MIMNSKKQELFGVVERVTPNKDYHGQDTETAKVTVDNVSRLISVDVDFRGMLGETETTAYPGIQGKINRSEIISTQNSLEEEIRRAKTQERVLQDNINRAEWATQTRFNEQQQQIDTIKSDYSTKEYVHSQLVAFNKLKKEIVDDIDLDNNKVIVSGELKDPEENVIYLVKQALSSEDTTYVQYTLIEGKLTYIGSSNIDLSNYATNDYVDQKFDSIPSTYLWEYAKSVDIPDVSNFITEIPSEYVTESELADKSYLTTSLAEKDYATKIYVQTEIARIGSLEKIVVSKVNTELNQVLTVDGQWISAKENTVYLVKQENNDYKQYTLINGKLTLVGTSSVDLEGYATEEFVTSAIEDSLQGYATEDYVSSEIKKIPEVDLSGYAKKSDIPTKSQIISYIPESYVTEDELNGTLTYYLTKDAADKKYADKAYVQSAISNLGAMSRQLVTAIDLTDNMVLIEGVWSVPQINVIYMLRQGKKYEQYIILEEDAPLTYIGSIDADTDSFATTAYVDSKIKDELESYSTTKQVSDEITSQLEPYAKTQQVDSKLAKVNTRIDNLGQTYATITNVNAQVEVVNSSVKTLQNDVTSNYATKKYVEDAVKNVEVDLSLYAKTADLKTLEANSKLIYSTKTELNDFKDHVEETYATQAALTAVNSKFDSYVTEDNLNQQLNNIKEYIPDDYVTSDNLAMQLENYLTEADAERTYQKKGEGSVDESQVNNLIVTYLSNIKFIDGGTTI